MRSLLVCCLVSLWLLPLVVSLVSAVDVPHKSCAGPHDDLNLTSIESAVWPPSKGSEVKLNISGVNAKAITEGTYTITIRVNGVPLPNIEGNIDVFKPLPWPVGSLQFNYSQSIPSIAPSGQYALHISAVDQDKVEIFCVTLSFTLSLREAVEAEWKQGRVRPPAAGGATVTVGAVDNSNRVPRVSSRPRMRQGRRV